MMRVDLPKSSSMKLSTAGQIRELIKDLPDDTVLLLDSADGKPWFASVTGVEQKRLTVNGFSTENKLCKRIVHVLISSHKYQKK